MVSNLLQLAAFAVADVVTWRFAGPNAGLIVIAAILFILALAVEGGEINVLGALGRVLARIGKALAREQDVDELAE